MRPRAESALPPPQELLPQERPMMLLDEVLDANDTGITSRARVRAGNPFVAGGPAGSVGLLLELMAQAAGALSGLEARRRAEPPSSGLLVAVPLMEISETDLTEGDELTISATRRASVSGGASFECAVHRRGSRLARARLTVQHAEGAP